MKTKLSSLAFACALVCLAATMVPGTSATARAAADARACSEHMLRGLYLWTFDGYASLGGSLVPKAVMQGLRFNGDGTTFNPFGTVNIGGKIIFDAGGFSGTYTVHRHPVTGARHSPNFQYIRRARCTAGLDSRDRLPRSCRHRSEPRNGGTGAVVKAPTTSSV